MGVAVSALLAVAVSSKVNSRHFRKAQDLGGLFLLFFFGVVGGVTNPPPPRLPSAWPHPAAKLYFCAWKLQEGKEMSFNNFVCSDCT
jgi:hypothetical protein